MELILDKCETAEMHPVGEGGHSSILDKSSCQVSGRTSGDFEQLNVVDPLQLGGVAHQSAYSYPNLPLKTAFNGCIRNFMVKDEVTISSHFANYPRS